jgi:hypothetical protein
MASHHTPAYLNTADINSPLAGRSAPDGHVRRTRHDAQANKVTIIWI